MVDDWSLKGKIKYHIVTQCEEITEEKYCKEDIETLRQKLIEDLINKFKHECGTCGQAVILDDEIIKIINKRFGYDEKKVCAKK